MTKLQELRKRYKYTRKELSRASGVGENTIYKLEKGSLDFRNCKLTTVVALAKPFGLKGFAILPSEIQKEML